MNIQPTPYFIRNTKRLKKKFHSLEKDLEQLKSDLLDNPQLGQSIGRSCYKVRMAITSKGKVKAAVRV